MFEIVAKRKAKYDIKEASALEQVKKSKTPILFIHGSKDDFVPEYMCQKLFDAAGCEKEKLIINGAGHTDGIYIEPWHFTENKIVYETYKTSSELSDEISKDLKKRGMKFVGTTIIYSYLQAIGVIYSHEKGCFLKNN